MELNTAKLARNGSSGAPPYFIEGTIAMPTLLRCLRFSRCEHRNAPARRGQAMVEFTLTVLFAFLPLIFGTIELGRGVWYYHQLSQLSREGARWLIVTTAHQTYHKIGNRPNHTPTEPNTVWINTWPQFYVLGACGCDAATAVGHMAAMETGLDENQVKVKIMQHMLPGDTITTAVTGTPYPKLIHGTRVTVAVEYPYQPILASYLRIPAVINLKAQTSMQLQ